MRYLQCWGFRSRRREIGHLGAKAEGEGLLVRPQGLPPCGWGCSRPCRTPRCGGVRGVAGASLNTLHASEAWSPGGFSFHWTDGRPRLGDVKGLAGYTCQ